MTVSDNTIAAEGLGDFFISLGEKGVDASKKMARNVWIIPERASEIAANVSSAFPSNSPKAALSTLPKLINFCHTGG